MSSGLICASISVLSMKFHNIGELKTNYSAVIISIKL